MSVCPSSDSSEFQSDDQVIVDPLDPTDGSGLVNVVVTFDKSGFAPLIRSSVNSVLSAATFSSSGVNVAFTVKLETLMVLLSLSELSVTLMVQLEYVASASVLNVIVFKPTVAAVVELEQSPPYVIVPASSDVKA